MKSSIEHVRAKEFQILGEERGNIHTARRPLPNKAGVVKNVYETTRQTYNLIAGRTDCQGQIERRI